MIGRKRVLLGTLIGWRPAFGILIAVSALVLLLSFRLKPDEGRPDVEIDLVGVVFAAAAIASSVSASTISTGGDWGSPEASAPKPRRFLRAKAIVTTGKTSNAAVPDDLFSRMP